MFVHVYIAAGKMLGFQWKKNWIKFKKSKKSIKNVSFWKGEGRGNYTLNLFFRSVMSATNDFKQNI